MYTNQGAVCGWVVRYVTYHRIGLRMVLMYKHTERKGGAYAITQTLLLVEGELRKTRRANRTKVLHKANVKCCFAESAQY